MFSRHISKTVKSIHPNIYELQERYRFHFEIKVNINTIVITIFLHNSNNYILSTISDLIKKKMNNLWKSSFLDFSKNILRVYLHSVS